MSQKTTSIDGLQNEVPLRRSMRLNTISRTSTVESTTVSRKEAQTKRCLPTENLSVLKEETDVIADKSSNLDVIESSQSQKEIFHTNIDRITNGSSHGNSGSIEQADEELPKNLTTITVIPEERCNERKKQCLPSDSEKYKDRKSTVEVIDNEQVPTASNSTDTFRDKNFTKGITIENLKKKLSDAIYNKIIKQDVEHITKEEQKREEATNISSGAGCVNDNPVTTSTYPDVSNLEVPATIIDKAREKNDCRNVNCFTTLKEDNIVGEDTKIYHESLECENKENDSDNGQMKKNSIDSKIDELLLTALITPEDSDNEHNSFIDSMAEEGEEDTPSENSNDIVEVGEEINTTESELSTDEEYETDSFIDDEENYQLLSGDEYDLSIDNLKKQSRIIHLSSGDDDDDYEIIRINRPKKNIQKKRKKSRIIKFEDSSDEDITTNPKSDIQQDEKKCDLNFDGNDLTNNEGLDERDVTETTFRKDNDNVTDLFNASEKNKENVCNENCETSIKNECSYCTDDSQDQLHNISSHCKGIEKNITNNTNILSKSLPSLPLVNDTIINKESLNKKIVIIENIKLQDFCNKSLSDLNDKNRNSYSQIKNAGELSENVVGYNNTSGVSETYCQISQPQHPFGNKIDSGKKSVTSGDVEIHDKNSDNALEKIYEYEKNKKFKNESNTKKTKKRTKKWKTPNSNDVSKLSAQGSFESRMFINSQNIENEKTNKYEMQTKTTKKRKFLKSEPFIVDTNDKHLFDEPVVKRKKRNVSSDKRFTHFENIKMNIMDEALLYDVKTRAPIVETNLLENVKPAYACETQSKQQKQNTVKCGISEKSFHTKDFKNLMLYDKTRVKRIGVDKLLKKKKMLQYCLI